MSEQEIKNLILEYLSYRRDVFVFPVDSVGIFDPSIGRYRRKNSRFHIRGVSDILGIIRLGNGQARPLGIEVKSKTGVVSPYQKAFLQRFQEMGGVAFVARSVEDVVAQLENLERGA